MRSYHICAIVLLRYHPQVQLENALIVSKRVIVSDNIVNVMLIGKLLKGMLGYGKLQIEHPLVTVQMSESKFTP